MDLTALIGRTLIICGASIAAMLAVASQQPTGVNVDLIDNPVVVEWLSPDGQHIGLLAPVDGRNVLTIIKRLRGPQLIFLNLNPIGRLAILLGKTMPVDVWITSNPGTRRQPLRASGLR